jgi:hypothetical protein
MRQHLADIKPLLRDYVRYYVERSPITIEGSPGLPAISSRTLRNSVLIEKNGRSQ